MYTLYDVRAIRLNAKLNTNIIYKVMKLNGKSIKMKTQTTKHTAHAVFRVSMPHQIS